MWTKQQNRDRFVQMVGALAQLINTRDASTGRHSRAVQRIAVAVGRQLGLADKLLKEIAVAAILHDIGKMGIPERILHKPGALTGEEYVVVRQHCVFGYTALRQVKALNKIAEYILSHHERYDGRGYPQGLRGEQIPFISRILCVADVFEAITADRVYRPAMSLGQALTIMDGGRGTIFDPTVLSALLTVLGPEDSAVSDASARNRGWRPGQSESDARSNPRL